MSNLPPQIYAEYIADPISSYGFKITSCVVGCGLATISLRKLSNNLIDENCFDFEKIEHSSVFKCLVQNESSAFDLNLKCFFAFIFRQTLQLSFALQYVLLATFKQRSLFSYLYAFQQRLPSLLVALLDNLISLCVSADKCDVALDPA